MLLCLSINAHAIQKVVYGTDNRVDVAEHPNEGYRTWAKSTAVRIPISSLETQGDRFLYKKTSLGQSINLCSKERFIDQPDVGECSGFLVADDILVTAGHCAKSLNDCSSNVWVFDYAKDKLTENYFSKDKVFQCLEVLYQKQDSNNMADFAIVRLDRSTGRTPLSYRKEGKIEDGSSLVVIGYPSGLPAKIDDGGIVRQNENEVYFKGDLDTFGGNSGSAVFNAKSGEVEGILVRGAVDYIMDPELKCKVVNNCKELTNNESCEGEGVTRITLLGLDKYISGEYLNQERPASPFNNSEPDELEAFIAAFLAAFGN